MMIIGQANGLGPGFQGTFPRKQFSIRYHTFGFNRLKVGSECRDLSRGMKLKRHANTHEEPTMSVARSVTGVTELDGITSTRRLTIDACSAGFTIRTMPTA
jgi:hypothetical protein